MFARHALSRQGAARTMAWGLAALSMAMCVRELDLRGSMAPDWLAVPTYEPGQTVVILIILAAFFFHALRHVRQFGEIVGFLLTPRTAAYVAAGALLVISGIAEHAHALGAYAIVVEEWLELAGFVLFVLAGVYFPYVADAAERKTAAARNGIAG
jgi:hypothetical protein